jgi:hypothetical protein
MEEAVEMSEMAKGQTPITALDLVEQTLDFLLERIPQVPDDDPHRDVLMPPLLALKETLAGLRGA